MDFQWTSAEAIYGSPPTLVFDFGTRTSAEAARDAVLAALNDYNAQLGNPPPHVHTSGPQDLSINPILFSIGFDSEWRGAQTVDVLGVYDNPTGTWLEVSLDTRINSDRMSSWAHFSPVPVPAAVWLFASGVVALRAVARSRKQTG